MIRRICFYGGANTGKSVEAAKAFVALKMEHKRIELVNEYVKEWVFEKRIPEGLDQHYIFHKQLHKEDLRLRAGMDFITTDCPVFLGACYAKKNGILGWELLYKMSDLVDSIYEPLNIYLERGDKPFDPLGRYEPLEKSKEMDSFILDELRETGKKFHVLHSLDTSTLLNLLTSELIK